MDLAFLEGGWEAAGVMALLEGEKVKLAGLSVRIGEGFDSG